MAGLLLRAVDVAADQRRWRWLLTDASSGAPLADHQVAIEAGDAEAEAFLDLYRHLRWNAEPDRRTESETFIVDRIGAWAGERILGAAVGKAIVAAAPVTVRVQAPDWLLTAPLELAHAGRVPLARRGDVSLVFDVGGDRPGPPAQRDHLRMVAVFSLPTETTALALRRERYELARLVRKLAARSRRNVRLEILQYGATRKVLRERMTDGGGPDVLHLSGHGATGLVYLETDDGGPDRVELADLLDLLRPAKGRLRLTVLSACQSAAVATAETLRWLKLDEAADEAQQKADADLGRVIETSGIAQRVARQLGCAVVAMRYPVVDDFAISLAGFLYEGLFELNLPVDRAVARAVPAAAGPVPSPASPALSIATPTVLGAAAIGMSLTPPRGPALVDLAEQRMAGFPDEPERFVGRAGVMARASRALAPSSGQSGVLFHGMAGAGKTSCAVELAYRNADRFALPVWWQAPTRDEEWPQALTGLALALETQVPGLTMVDKLVPEQTFQRFLPALRNVLRNNGFLLVLDNVETLLTEVRQWRDPRWGQLMEALTGHGGESRVVMTSRVRPAGLAPNVQVEPVHALSRDEAALLARELPHLRRLLHTDPGPTRLHADTDRATVRRVLHVVQGHPKLLELADAAAADPDALAAQLSAAEAAVDDQALSAFFTQGESTLDDQDFLGTLAGWTRATMGTLPEGSQLLLRMLAGMEEDDRESAVVEANWEGLCRRLELAVPDLADGLAPLTSAALVDATPTTDAPARYRLHPGVAETVRADTPAEVRVAVDVELGSFWRSVSQAAVGRAGGEASGLVVRAGLAAAPYLLRRAEWDAVTSVIERVLTRDATEAVAQLAVALMGRVVRATGAARDLATLGRAMVRVDVVAGDRVLREAWEQSVIDNDHILASNVTGDLVGLYRRAGRLTEALTWSDRAAEHTALAGLGPWTQLGDQVQRLQIVSLQGEHEHVLAEVYRLRQVMAGLADPVDHDETVYDWGVRESMLNLGVLAAVELGRWQEALDFNAANVASKQTRGAGAHAVAFAIFNDHGPLLRLGRPGEAEQLLLDCQGVFETHGDLPNLAKTLSARADLAAGRRQNREAIGLEHTALRLKYIHQDPVAISVSHHNLANYLASAGVEPPAGLAHRLAAAVICLLTGQDAYLTFALRELARDLGGLTGVVMPATIGELAAVVKQVEGVRFAELVTELVGDLDTAQQALDEVLRAVAEAGSGDDVA